MPHRAATMVELKAKLRRAMGWPDRRSWTEAERKAVAAKYVIRPDFQRGGFVATKITEN